MSSHYTALSDLGPVALSHRDEIDEVKRHIGLRHGHFDAWIYGFLENKKFNIEETVAKLHRRFAMERNELGHYELNDFMRESLRKGIIQDIGHDKQGRTVLYVTTARDKPTAKHRAEQRCTFDMFLNYATRLRPNNKRCQAVMLINQDKASMWSNLDMTMQAEIALRVSKFYPGMLDKMYICKMGTTLSAMAKPIFRTLPAVVSDRIQIIDDRDIKNGVLFDIMDRAIVPDVLGGLNHCDDEAHWEQFALRIESYFTELKEAVNERGMTVKEWELEKCGINPQMANDVNSLDNDEEEIHMDTSSNTMMQMRKRMNRTSSSTSTNIMLNNRESSILGASYSDTVLVDSLKTNHASPSTLKMNKSNYSENEFAERVHSVKSSYQPARPTRRSSRLASRALSTLPTTYPTRVNTPRPAVDGLEHNNNNEGNNITELKNKNDSLLIERIPTDDIGVLQTCVSTSTEWINDDTWNAHRNEMEWNEEEQQNNNIYTSNNEYPITWSSLMAYFPRPFATFFLEELLEWREKIEEEEMTARYKLTDKIAKVLEEEYSGSEVKGLNVHDTRWYYYVPLPLRELYQLVLFAVTFLNVIYFLAALVFIAVFAANIIVTIFLGFHVKATHFFPLSCVLINVMVQGPALCSRATDTLMAIYEGKVIPLFVRLGSYWGTMAEVILFVVLVAVQFIIFCVLASTSSPLHALQVSFATGWLCAVFLIAITHVFFFTGIFVAKNIKAEDNSWSRIPFLIALHIEGDISKDEEQTNNIRTTSFLICGIPVTVSMLLGIGFLLSNIMALFPSTVVAAFVAAFCVNYFSDSAANSLSGSLMRITLWMMTIVWLYVTFTFGFRPFSGIWATTVSIAMIVNGIFVLLAFVCMQRPKNTWLLRCAFIIILLYIVVCWILQFPFLTFRLGIFCVVLMVHNILSIVLARKPLVNMNAVFCVAAAVLLLVISCILLGWYGTTLQYTYPQSIPSTSTISNVCINSSSSSFSSYSFAAVNKITSWSPSQSSSTLSSFMEPELLNNVHEYHQYPVCTLQMGNVVSNSINTSSSSGTSLSIIDLALMVEVTMARTRELLEHDFTTWFANRAMNYNGVNVYFPSDDDSWELHEFTATASGSTSNAGAKTFRKNNNKMKGKNDTEAIIIDNISPEQLEEVKTTTTTTTTTVYVLNNRYSKSSIVGMVAWIDSIALSPLSIFLPYDWVSDMVWAMSFMTRLIEYAWMSLITSLANFLREQQRLHPDNHIILSGFGVAGGIASAAAVQARTECVVFSAPGLLHELRKLNVSYGDYHEYVLAVGAYYGVLDNVGGQDFAMKQKLNCDGDAKWCLSQQFISTELLSQCNDPFQRQHGTRMYERKLMTNLNQFLFSK